MVIIGIIILILIAISYYFSEKIIGIKIYDNEGVVDLQLKEGVLTEKDLEDNTFETIELTSTYGYLLHGRLYKAKTNNDMAVVISHGVTVSKISSLKYMKVFREMGYDCLLIDHRKHGDSGGIYTSYGYYEKQDMRLWMEYMKINRYYESVGIHGESMGSAIALQYAGMDESKADYVIVDCPFDSLWKQLSYRMKVENNLPAFPLLYATSLMVFLRAGFWIHDVSPIKALETIDCPVMFIHSENDRYIPYDMTKGMFDQFTGKKFLYKAKFGNHAQSLQMNKEDYIANVNEFLTSI